MMPPNTSRVNFRLGRFRLPPEFKLWPDMAQAADIGPLQTQVKLPSAARMWPDAFPALSALTFPQTPPIPPPVASGDLITAVHENTVTEGISDLWIDLQWLAANAVTNPTTTKGDLIVSDGSLLARLPVGANTQVLTTDLTTPLGIKWATPAAGGGSYVPTSRRVNAGAGMTGGGALTADVTLNANVTSVFGRTGDVVLGAGDITAAGGVPATRRVIAGAGLTGGGPLSADVTLSAVPLPAGTTTGDLLYWDKPGAAWQTLDLGLEGTTLQASPSGSSKGLRWVMVATPPDPSFYVNGTLVYQTRKLNLIAGANVTISGVANSGQGRADITINATGGSGGGTGSQTPWLQDIDAAGFMLTNASIVGFAFSGANVGALVAGGTGELRLESNPGVSLVLSGAPVAVASDTYISLQTNLPNVERVRITAAGLVGIVNSSPVNAVEVGSAGFTAFAGTHLTIGNTDNNSGVDVGQGISRRGRMLWACNPITPNSAYLVVETIGGNPLCLQTQGGSVGISVLVPAYKLDVAGDCNITGTYRVNGVPIATGGGGSSQTPWTSNIDGAGFALNNAGLIGIGTVPGALLHVKGNYASAIFEDPLASVTNGGKIRLSSNSAGLWAYQINTAAAGDFSAVNYSLMLGPTGNVGIGRAPEALLDVNGTAFFRTAVSGLQNATSGKLIRIGVNPGTSYGDILCYNYDLPGFHPLNIRGSPIHLTGGNVGIGIDPPGTVTYLLSLGAFVTARKFAVYDSGGDFFGFGVSQATFRYDSGLSSDHVFFADGGTERMRITRAGNVGITTSVPNFPLSMGSGLGDKIALWDGGPGVSYGLGMQSGVIQLHCNSILDRVGIGYGTSASMVETLTVTGGNVGINTATLGPPGTKLHILGDGPLSVRLGTANSLAYYWDIGRENVTTGDFLMNCAAGTGAVEKFRVNVAGDVLISNGRNFIVQYGSDSGLSLYPGTGVSRRGYDGALMLTAAQAAVIINGPQLQINCLIDAWNRMGISSNVAGSAFSQGAIEVRESGRVGAQLFDLSHCPRIGFHWAGAVASQIGMDWAGTIRTFDNPGTGYAPFACGALYTNGVQITSSGLATIVNVTASRTMNTIYQNTAKPLYVSVVLNVPANAWVYAYADGGATPGTVVGSTVVTGAASYQTVAFWVMPSHYFKLTWNGSTGTVSMWIEYY